MAFDRVEVITDGGRRRRYCSDEKARLVARAFAPGSSVAAFARGHGVDPSLLYRWRRQMGPGTAAAVSFSPVIVAPGSPRVAPVVERVEIVLGNGRRLLVSETVETSALMRIIAAAERA